MADGWIDMVYGWIGMVDGSWGQNPWEWILPESFNQNSLSPPRYIQEQVSEVNLLE